MSSQPNRPGQTPSAQPKHGSAPHTGQRTPGQPDQGQTAPQRATPGQPGQSPVPGQAAPQAPEARSSQAPGPVTQAQGDAGQRPGQPRDANPAKTAAQQKALQADIERKQREHHQRQERVHGEVQTREAGNNPATAGFRQYDARNMPGMDPRNLPADRRNGEWPTKGTRLDLEDVTGNPGHRGVNPDAPAGSVNFNYADARLNPPSINEPPGAEPPPRVERMASAPGTPLAGQGVTGSINEPPGSSIGSKIGTGSVDPGPSADPTLTFIDPSSAAIGSADLTLRVVGTGFTDQSKIVFNGGEEPTTFVNASELTTGVKPSTAGTPGAYDVLVRTGSHETTPQSFTFTEAATPAEDPAAVVARNAAKAKEEAARDRG